MSVLLLMVRRRTSLVAVCALSIARWRASAGRCGNVSLSLSCDDDDDDDDGDLANTFFMCACLGVLEDLLETLYSSEA